jgi:hypothetical protein
MRNNLILLFLFLIPGILFIRCARPGTLTGGPQDITPPKATSAVLQTGLSISKQRKSQSLLTNSSSLKTLQKRYLFHRQ